MVSPAVSAPRERFAGLARRLGATQDPVPLAEALVTAWSGPGRVYHGIRHLEDSLHQLDALRLDPGTRDLVEAAIWFHDAVYDTRAADNEERSARWAAEALPALGVPTATTDAIARLVRLTRDHAPVSDAAGRLLLDIDLSVLGRPAAEFDDYERRIREEYAWVPDPVYRAGRARVLSDFLRRDPLFQTESFQRLEVPARANLRRSLDTLAMER